MNNYIQIFKDVLDPSYCDELVSKFEKNTEHHETHDQGPMSFTQINFNQHLEYQDDVEKLTIAMAKLKDISSELVNEVIKEYYDMMVARNYVEEGGMGYASSVLEAAMGKDNADSLIRKINASSELKQPAVFGK